MSNKKITNIQLGSDPEVFLKNQDTGEFVSVEGLLGGTKENPIPITEEGHAIQEDNCSAEFNIPACRNADDMHNHIQFVLDYINNKIKSKGLVVTTEASVIFDKKYLQSEQALTFGCEPDINAYTLNSNDIADTTGDMRSAGGHIHVGYNNPDLETSIELIKALDLFLGIPSMIMDKDTRRKELYGKSGAFRIKDYGCEYRVLSNFWIFNKETVNWVFKGVQKAVDFVNDGHKLSKDDETLIQEAINNNNKEAINRLSEMYNLGVSEVVEV